jgi:hypothetical protein
MTSALEIMELSRLTRDMGIVNEAKARLAAGK